MAGAIVGGAISAAGSMGAAALGRTKAPAQRFTPPALGWGSRRYGPALASRLFGIAQGGGGMDAGQMAGLRQQTIGNMAPMMATAGRNLRFSQMGRGIFDSSVGQQQEAALQGGFYNMMGRSMLDIALQNETQRRAEMFQAINMLMGGIGVGQQVQTYPTQSTGSAVAQAGGNAMSQMGQMMMLQQMMKNNGGGSGSGGMKTMTPGEINGSYYNGTTVDMGGGPAYA